MKKTRKAKSSADVIDLNEAREKRRAKREAELNKKNKKVARPKSVKVQASKKQIRINNKIRYTVFFSTLIVLLLVGVSMFNIVELKVQENQALALSEKLKAQKTSLQHEISLVNSPEYIEQQARLQLKMIKPGEILYVFPQKENIASDPTSVTLNTNIDAAGNPLPGTNAAPADTSAGTN